MGISIARIEEKHHFEADRILTDAYPAEGWCVDDIRKFLGHKKHHNIGRVFYHTQAKKKILGILLCTLETGVVRIRRVAVDEQYRRQGVGRRLLAFLADPNGSFAKRRLVARLSERNLIGQLFLKSCGLRCDRVDRNKLKGRYGFDDAFVFSKEPARVAQMV